MRKNFFWILFITSSVLIISIFFENLKSITKSTEEIQQKEKTQKIDSTTTATPEIEKPTKSDSSLRYTEVNHRPHPAMFYEELPGNIVKCKLCPWECMIKPGERGICEVRENQNGKLITLVYARACSINIDPIEKKPFYHFMPSEATLSLATAGCNLNCKFCQNWTISQVRPEDIDAFYIPPEAVIQLARRTNSKVIAFTYSEPVVFYEYMLDTAKLAKQAGIKSVVVTGGFINTEPLKLLCKYVSAIKIDLKAFNEKYYKEVVEGRLQPVLDAIKTIKQEGIHLEIVYLVVPTLNDNPEEIKNMCKWLKENVGDDVPLHFSRFYPQYKMQNYPATPVLTLEKLRKIAIDSGMKYVYIGNVQPDHPAGSTYCFKCKKLLIKRFGYQILENNITSGKCKYCGEKIYGVW